MRRLATVLALALGLSGCVYADVPVTRASHLIVLDNATGAPIAGARVTIRSVADPRLQISGLTDAAGHVDLPSVIHRDVIVSGSPPQVIDENLFFAAAGYDSYKFQATYGSPHIPERCLTIHLLRTGTPYSWAANSYPLNGDCDETPASPPP